MSANRAFIVALSVIGGSVFILTEVWYGTDGNIWLLTGVLLAVLLVLYLYWRFLGHHIDSRHMKRLGWAYVIGVGLLHYLLYHTSYTNRSLRLAGVFVYSLGLAVGLSELIKWLNRNGEDGN